MIQSWQEMLKAEAVRMENGGPLKIIKKSELLGRDD